jgi:hypothetical protein
MGERQVSVKPMRRKPIELVLKENAGRLMLLYGVTGVAVGKTRGKLCIRVFIGEKTDELQRQIPASLEGYPVLVEEKGRFRALDP